MKITLAKIGLLAKASFKIWFDRDPFRESAIIAYNAVFSLPGLLVVVVSLAGYFFGTEAVNGQLHRQISQVMGNSAADQLQQMVLMASKSKHSVAASIFGIATILIGATGVFVQLQKSLNIIWEVKATPGKSGIISFLKTRVFSFGLIVSIAFLLLIFLFLSSMLTVFSSWVQQHWSPSLLILFQILNFIFSFGVIALLFGLMFKTLPDAKIKWHSVWVGAIATSLLFVIGKSLLGFYFGTASPGSGYGAAGAVILILLWTSYSSMIVLFGAQFTKMYSEFYDGDVEASANAVNQKDRVK
ncbi:MAG: YihY/virulence factor BrkB family protein [Chitinophagales bacterium]|nr:YihY/virulence factor BrkB family protein [Chitinophagales bacterium]